MSVMNAGARGIGSGAGNGASQTPFDQDWVPRGYVGPVALPGTGRMVWWTGRIAIGLRYAAQRNN